MKMAERGPLCRDVPKERQRRRVNRYRVASLQLQRTPHRLDYRLDLVSVQRIITSVVVVVTVL